MQRNKIQDQEGPISMKSRYLNINWRQQSKKVNFAASVADAKLHAANKR